MTKSEVKIGAKYRARVSGRTVPVLIEGAAGNRKGWVAKNLITGRIVYIRTARRLSIFPTTRCKICPTCMAVQIRKMEVMVLLEDVPLAPCLERTVILNDWKTYCKEHPCESPVEV